MSVTTTPFLGCKISLISKSEIRYEGILYTIDPKESTIALAKVRSYGTEDRPAERQVPPREEIFEYIIFRAGDIKDLIVDDPPASIAPGLADPAIIQAHSTSTSGATFPSTTFPEMSRNANVSANSGQRTTGAAFSSGQSAINSLTLATSFNSNASNESRSQNSTPTGAQQHHRHSPSGEKAATQQTHKQNAPRDNQRKSSNERALQSQPIMRRGGGAQQQNHQNYANRRGSGQQNYRQNQSHSQPQQTNNRFGGYNRQFNNYGNAAQRRPPIQSRPQSTRGSQNRISNRPAKEPIKFDKDFDFEKGLEEFSEMEKKFSNLKVETNSEVKAAEDNTNANEGSANGDKENVESEQFYDKAKSFFDNISCEALEREKGNVQRIDWKAERKLNSETFGVPLNYRRMGFGRGRGGYGHRGYSGGFRPHRGGSAGGQAFNRGGGGDTRRFKGPQAPQNRN